MGCIVIKPKNFDLRNNDIQKKYKKIGLFGKIIRNKYNNINGFENLGNTCYINSIMQCLVKIPPLCDYFLNDIHLKSTKKKGKDYSNITNYFGDMVKNYYRKNKKTIKYSEFYNYLLNKYKIFEINAQEDAHEFLIFWLDNLHEELNWIKTEKKVSQIKSYTLKKEENEIIKIKRFAKEHWKNYLNNNKSIIIDLFQGQLKNTILCLKCKTVKINFECCMYFSLSIEEKKIHNNIYDCLKNYFKKEILKKGNRICCETCKIYTNGLKKINIWKFPEILVIHFKRFKYDKNESIKLNQFINFPEELQFKKSKMNYKLFSILNHEGTMNNGHYYSYIFEKYKQKWFEYNDSKFNEIEKKDIITNNAYILFYYKCDKKKEIIKKIKNKTFPIHKKLPLWKNIKPKNKINKLA